MKATEMQLEMRITFINWSDSYRPVWWIFQHIRGMKSELQAMSVSRNDNFQVADLKKGNEWQRNGKRKKLGEQKLQNYVVL